MFRHACPILEWLDAIIRLIIFMDKNVFTL